MSCCGQDLSSQPAITLGGKTYTVAEIEQLERATMRYVCTSAQRFIDTMRQVFEEGTDKAEDVAEDLTREALDTLGTSRIGSRLYGKTDFKQSRFIFLPDDVVPQALFVDSKAEKETPFNARIQITQTSMRVRQHRAGEVLDVKPELGQTVKTSSGLLLSTTVFVKYCYRTATVNGAEARYLDEVVVFCLPNGALQEVYNPDADHSIWIAGPDSPTRGEAFRTRIGLPALAAHPGGDPSQTDAGWRVQRFPVSTHGQGTQPKWEGKVRRTKEKYRLHREAGTALPLEMETEDTDE